MNNEQRIQHIAKALWEHRFREGDEPWEKYRLRCPDIAVIYEDMARVALKAMGELP